MGSVFRVRADEDELALKWLQVASGVTPLDRLRFEREFKLAKTFAHPSLVPVFDYGEFQELPYYTMEYVAGRNLRDYFTEVRTKASATEFWNILGMIMENLLNTLNYIHQRQIVHRDLKPDNILVDREGRPRLLDFGLAQERDFERVTEPGMVIGTVHYMAPEQILGEELEPRTDLYGFGVLLYEAITGELPFDGPDPISVLGQILHSPLPKFPDQPHPWPAGLADLVASLMSKSPSDRPLDVAAALERWQPIFSNLDRLEMKLPPLESTPQAANRDPNRILPPQFTGRADTLKLLRQRFQNLDGGFARVALSGSCGVGKSRLLNFLRVDATQNRLQMWESHAPEMESLPYELFLPFLRKTIRKGLPEELEGFRSSLAMLLPELATPDSESDWEDPMRKFHLFEGMLRLLLPQPGSAGRVLVLEDLQWAEPASLEFLSYLCRSVEERSDKVPLLLIMTYRHDEVAENSPFIGALRSWKREKGVETLRLEPFTPEETQAMVGSMLAVGKLSDDALERFHAETEGNPMFIEELLKTMLAEGRLQLTDDTWSFDQRSVMLTSAGGSQIPVTVRDAVKRRLQGLSGQDEDILRYAAVIGYRFSFALLAQVSRVPELELLERVLRMVRKRILADDGDGEAFRFYNHPISEVVLSGLAPEERRRYHLEVAQAMERLPNPASAFDLAHHYKFGGDPLSAVRHLLQSAEVSAGAFAYEKARELYTMASKFKEAEQMIEPLQLVERLAEVSHLSGLTEAAIEKFTGLLDQVKEPVTRARILRKLGFCWDGLGDVEQAHRCLTQALKELKYRLPSESKLGFIRLSARALATRLPMAAKKFRTQTEQSREMHKIVERLARVLFFLRPPGWLLDSVDLSVLQQILAGAVDARDTKAQAELYAGYMWLRAPNKMRQTARNRLLNSVRLARSLADDPFKAHMIRDAGYLLHLAGFPEKGLEVCEEGASLSERLGDIHGLAMNEILLTSILLHLGRVEEAAQRGRAATRKAEAVGNRRDLTLAYLEVARAEALCGRVEETRTYLRLAGKVEGLAQMSFLQLLELVGRGWLDETLEDYSSLLQRAKRGLELCQEISELPFYSLQLELMKLTAQVGLGETQDLEQLRPRLQSYPHLRLAFRRLELKQSGQLVPEHPEFQALLEEARSLSNKLEIGRLEAVTQP